MELSSPDLAFQYEEEPVEEVRMLDYQRKVTVLYELLSACLADIREDDKKSAAAVTGGAVLAITGGLGALAPTLGTLIPVIGATGFAAVASAAGTVAGSVAVAASFGAAGAGLTGTKMARRVGSVDEFEFKAIGENQNQGRLAVAILVSGFAFDTEDFVGPWEGQNDNLERSCDGVDEARCNDDCTKHSSSCIGLPTTLLSATDLIDSKWSVALDRCDKAGKLLAETSLFVYYADIFIENLDLNSVSAEFVERVVLLGAPIAIQDENWKAARKILPSRNLEKTP
ncbi:hypothetical protein SAY87_018307 [Trapa incisa]|uniref:Uncharacterized protein n=1 Tax=Trapa incisa TaxID=236973 RepID=A0AAN7LAJ7_9MYRT|nr:hypothetical protein SAY87_018307 [Trapa incisa]